MKASHTLGRRAAFLGLLMTVGLAVRLPHITDPPFEFQATRQFLFANIARDIYYTHFNTGVPASYQRAAAAVAHHAAIETPIQEWLSAVLYTFTGGEQLWIARITSVIVWVIGSALLFSLARALGATNGAFVGTALFLFYPYGVIASRSMQPDPLMVTLLILSCWTLWRYGENPTSRQLVLMTVAAAIAILVKAQSAFFITGVWGVCGLLEPWKRRFLMLSSLIVAGAPTAIWFIAIPSVRQQYFLPHYLGTSSFWSGWYHQIDVTVGVGTALVALATIVMCRAKRVRAFLCGLWLGYIALAIAFDYHISTHDYYSLPLVFLVSLSIALATQYLWGRRRLHRLVLYAVGLITAVTLANQASLFGPLYSFQLTSYEQAQIATDVAVGNAITHTDVAVALAPDYSFPLEYFGHMHVQASWPELADINFAELQNGTLSKVTTHDTFSKIIQSTTARWFVITDLNLFHQDTALQCLLAVYPISARGNEYLIYDLRGAWVSMHGGNATSTVP